MGSRGRRDYHPGQALYYTDGGRCRGGWRGRDTASSVGYPKTRGKCEQLLSAFSECLVYWDMQTLVDTVIFHIDAMTGEDARKVSPTADLLQGFDIISGPIVEAFFLQNSTRTVVLFDEYMQVSIILVSLLALSNPSL